MKKLIQIISIVLIINILMICSGCSVAPKQIVNLGDFVKVRQTGYDGYGTTEFYIDYEQIVDICEAPAVNKENIKAHLAQSFYPYTTSVSTIKKTSNGQVINVNFIESSTELINAFQQGLNIKFVTTPMDYTIKNLPALTKVDFFDMMVVDTNNTISGTGSAEFKTSCIINGKSMVFNLQHNGENGKLKNGDKITITIAEDYDMDAFIANTGFAPTHNTKEIEVDFLAEYAIKDNILTHLDPDGEDNINKVVEEWVVSGANDYSVKDINNRKYKCVGYVLHTNNDNIENITESTLSAVYVVSDETLSHKYYVTMSITGILAFDNNNHISIDGKDLPKSFAYYEKETVKWSHITGWEQGCEGQGFLVEGTPYAGHITLEEAFQFLRTQYGETYEKVYYTIPIDMDKIETENEEIDNIEVERDEG